ncbi:hypothetical protein bsdcttw_32130 [Anaerocolumna chitinilytica]|uniref:Uncharacterized protein n=1 Tax=Anaerocolumna chitinilytica TaxID=1727145 RepID=A0A7I8DPE8_9FIRM|nr:hypothetical protein bsdcttw_32130 [Anaerocolumna chitinilytica]
MQIIVICKFFYLSILVLCNVLYVELSQVKKPVISTNKNAKFALNSISEPVLEEFTLYDIIVLISKN